MTVVMIILVCMVVVSLITPIIKTGVMRLNDIIRQIIIIREQHRQAAREFLEFCNEYQRVENEIVEAINTIKAALKRLIYLLALFNLRAFLYARFIEVGKLATFFFYIKDYTQSKKVKVKQKLKNSSFLM
jgi:hypothetical protein